MKRPTKSSSKWRDPPVVLPIGKPHEAVRDYFVSKSQNYLMKIVPDPDPVGRDPGLRLWRAHEAKTRAREVLEETRKENEEEQGRMRDKWSELKEKQAAFREAFVKFNKFLCENDDKIERFKKRDEANRKIVQEKLAEIEDKKHQLQELTTVGRKMDEFLDEHRIYEDYLLKVVEQSGGEFKTPLDIIQRYEELNFAKDELSASQEENISSMMTEVTNASQLVENRKLQIIGMSNELAQLRIRHESIKNESKKWEEVLHKIQNETIKRQSEFNKILECLWQLYERICKDKGISTSCSKDDYEVQFIVVMRGIAEIKRIVQRAEERERSDLATNVAQASSLLSLDKY